jgi:RNA polymerase sigma-70 factor, ECF subfamily
MSDLDDAALITLALKGDESGFAELVRRYQSAVWRTVYRTLGNSRDNEDAVQEIFLRAFRSLGRFNVAYPFGPWIVSIATNYSIDQLRRRRKLRYRLLSDLDYGEQQRALRDFARNGDFQSHLDQAPETYEKIAADFLQNLQPKYRVAFVLRELENRTYEEIASMLGTSQLNARVRVSRARTEIRRKFEAYLTGKSADA